MRQATEYHAKVETDVLLMPETLWKNNLNCVKDVIMIDVNFITRIIVTILR